MFSFPSFLTIRNLLLRFIEKLVILGDFSIHVDAPSDADAGILQDFFQCLGLEQHVREPTHILGHTSDLIISRNISLLLMACQVVIVCFQIIFRLSVAFKCVSLQFLLSCILTEISRLLTVINFGVTCENRNCAYIHQVLLRT